MPRSGIAISHGNLMFIFLKNCFFSAFLLCQLKRTKAIKNKVLGNWGGCKIGIIG